MQWRALGLAAAAVTVIGMATDVVPAHAQAYQSPGGWRDPMEYHTVTQSACARVAAALTNAVSFVQQAEQAEFETASEWSEAEAFSVVWILAWDYLSRPGSWRRIGTTTATLRPRLRSYLQSGLPEHVVTFGSSGILRTNVAANRRQRQAWSYW